MSDLHDNLVRGEPGEALSALRAVLADALLEVEPSERHQVAKAYMAVLAAQQQIAVPESSASDALAERRAARRAAAQAAATS